MEIEVSELQRLLEQTQRMALINNKMQPQVLGCVIDVKGTYATTTNIVRDGVTSISRFIANLAPPEHGPEQVLIANISKVLGLLKKHSGVVEIYNTDNKLRIRNKTGVKRQSTVISDSRAKAFPHINKSIAQWDKESNERFESALSDISKGKYNCSGGDGTVQAFFTLKIKAGLLLDALECGNVNGQKITEYLFCAHTGVIWVEVGDYMNGFVSTHIGPSHNMDFVTSVAGGLDNVLRKCDKNEEVKLLFFDFKDQGAGISVALLSSSLCVFQREVPDNGSNPK